MVSGLMARLRSLWRGLRHRADLEAEMTEEFRHHLELRTEDLIRRGIGPAEATRRARIEFGHIDSHRADARVSRGLGPFDEMRFSALDVRLGLRMLLKYPGLSLVSVIGMSVAIAVGAGAFGFIAAMLDPALPLDEGDRVVSVQNADARRAGDPDRRSLHDFVAWREALTTIDDLSAFTTDKRNLLIPGKGVALVRIAQMSASGFRVARTPPALGRPLHEEDERVGAPPVVVIAYEEWQRRFDEDPGIVGRQVRLGGDVYTVVGVMPEGFHFPVNHRYWVPLRLDPAGYERGGGPSLVMFGRLAAGATLDAAQAELTAIGSKTAARYPETHAHLRPRILPYTHDHVDIDSPMMAWVLRGFQAVVSLLLVVVAVNVAVLVYARTATRAGEIAVRRALGASRRRIVAQLFAEAVVLSGVAAVVGLTMAGIALRTIEAFQMRVSPDQFPFWFDLGLSPGLVIYVAGLAMLGGVIVGVLPGLKATGRPVQVGLQRRATHGSGMQLGRMWTAMIVAQVAVAVAVLPSAVYVSGMSVRRGMAQPEYRPEEFLRASLSMEWEEAPPAVEAAEYHRRFAIRFRDGAAELRRRLEAEAAVSGAALASSFPGLGRFGRIEIEGGGTQPEGESDTSVADPSHSGAVRTSDIDVDLLTIFDVPILAGRGFIEGDARDGANAVIVDQVFVERVLRGAGAVGRHLRFVRRVRKEGGVEIEKGPWLEIVGVVPDFTVQFDFDPSDPKVYRPLHLAAGDTPALTLVVRVRDGTAPAFAQRLRAMVAAVDPALQLHELRSVADYQQQAQQALLGLALVIVGVTASVLLLSAAGIYAMMSFTVARRRREIGIRIALGAAPRRLLSSVFARASGQLGAGLVVGLALSVALDRAVGGGPVAAGGGVILPAVVALMTGLGLVAALGPARRSLAVQPTEALREE